MAGFADRVAAEALKVRPVRILLTLLAVPFYVIGWLVGFVIVAFVFALSAVKVGIGDARSKADRSPGDD